MRTNGLVLGVVIALLACNIGRADELANEPSVPADCAAGSAGCAAGPDDCSAGGETFDLSPECGSCDTHLFSNSMWKCMVGCYDGWALYVGTEFTDLNVASRTGGTTTLSFSDTTPPGVSSVSFREAGGVNDQGYAPRVWLGAQITDKWGVRGRYWRLSDTDFHPPDVTPGFTPIGTNFGTYEMTDRLDAWDADIEAVRTDQFGKWETEAFVGGRHASFSTDSSLLAFGVFTTGNFVNLTLQNGGAFNGTGVTYGGTIRRQIGDSHLYLFTTLRGSNLDGSSFSFARADGAVASSPSAPLVGAATVRRDGAPAEMAIFELQAGVEFQYALQCVPMNFFFRVAYEFQNWDVMGLPTGGAGFGGTIGEITTNSFSSANANLAGMTLSGISLGTGLVW